MSCSIREESNRRRGLSLLELVLALAMTTLVASGVTGMLAGLGSGIAVGRDARTAMLATAACQRRITNELADHAAILESNPTRTVLWVGDERPGGMVETSELTWLSADSSDEIVLERIVFPDDWTMLERSMVDRRLAPDDDPWTALGTLRARGVIERTVLADALIDARFTTIAGGRGLRIDVGFDLPTGRSEATISVPVRDAPPETMP